MRINKIYVNSNYKKSSSYYDYNKGQQIAQQQTTQGIPARYINEQSSQQQHQIQTAQQQQQQPHHQSQSGHHLQQGPANQQVQGKTP